MSTTTGRTGRGSEPALVRELARRAEDRIRTAVLTFLLAVAALGQLAFVVASASARPLLVYVEVTR